MPSFLPITSYVQAGCAPTLQQPSSSSGAAATGVSAASSALLPPLPPWSLARSPKSALAMSAWRQRLRAPSSAPVALLWAPPVAASPLSAPLPNSSLKRSSWPAAPCCSPEGAAARPPLCRRLARLLEELDPSTSTSAAPSERRALAGVGTASTSLARLLRSLLLWAKPCAATPSSECLSVTVGFSMPELASAPGSSSTPDPMSKSLPKHASSPEPPFSSLPSLSCSWSLAQNSSGKSFISSASVESLSAVPLRAITPSAAEIRPLLTRRSTACCTPRSPSTEHDTTSAAASSLCTSSHDEYGRDPSFAAPSRDKSAWLALTQMSWMLGRCSTGRGSSRVDICWQPRTYFNCGRSSSATRIPTTGMPSGCVTARTICSFGAALPLLLAGPEARRQALSTSPVRRCSKSSLLSAEASYC
mmetsp:Transcript_58833/g.162711  ORF Transcript_58833/g.162711 Transcript_58833/m.162711 type:complete len:418 (-) Transcript_58833:2135-3388(-)